MHRALLLTGVAGVGKTTVARAAGGVLTASGRVTAVVDTDMLAQFGPPPRADRPGVPFYDRLKCANLAAVWANFKAAGARFVVVAAGVETPALRRLYDAGLTDCHVRLVRLTADVETVRDRLRRRDSGPQRERHLAALDGRGHAPAVLADGDFTVVNDRRPAEVATEILVRAGWLDGPG